jgi:hypothetical protein
VYLALRESRYWERMLLLVTYDAPGDDPRESVAC